LRGGIEPFFEVPDPEAGDNEKKAHVSIVIPALQSAEFGAVREGRKGVYGERFRMRRARTASAPVTPATPVSPGGSLSQGSWFKKTIVSISNRVAGGSVSRT